MNRIVAAGLMLLSVSACSSQKAAEPGAPGAPGGAGGGGRGGRGGGGPVPVITGHVQKKAVPVTIPAVGTAEALQTVQVRAQVTGQLSGIHFAEGQEVKKGQPLFTIDPRPFQAALEQAQAVLARDTATAKNSQSQQARYEDLYKRGLIARDQYESQAATASAQQATLAADQAAVDTARLNLQYTSVAAPISGRAGALTVHEGDLVRQNDTTPLLVINQMAPIYVGFSVPGRYLGDIRRYQAQGSLKVQARLKGSPTGPTQIAVGTPEGRGDTPAPPAALADPTPAVPPEEGVVSFIDNAVDPTTGTIKLKATFPNTTHSLWPGLFVQVTLLLTTDPDALVVPATAVQESQQGTYVYVIKPDRTAEMRTVRVERQQGEETVIAQGVSAGEEVVTDGHLRLTPGARVTTGEAGGRARGGQGGNRGGQGGQEGQRRQGGQEGQGQGGQGAQGGRRSGGTS
jgi:multidrug efflux system membrane fusion protein